MHADSILHSVSPNAKQNLGIFENLQKIEKETPDEHLGKTTHHAFKLHSHSLKLQEHVFAIDKEPETAGLTGDFTVKRESPRLKILIAHSRLLSFRAFFPLLTALMLDTLKALDISKIGQFKCLECCISLFKIWFLNISHYANHFQPTSIKTSSKEKQRLP